MEIKIWSKTFLNAYKYLGTIADAIDELVKKESINSAFYNRNESTFQQFMKLEKLYARKTKLINIKVLVEHALANLKPQETRLLTLYFVDELKSREIAAKLNISTRSFFRKKGLALNKFAANIMLQGYDSKKIENLVSGENWLNFAYNVNLQKENEDSRSIQKLKILSYAIKEIKKSQRIAL